MCQHLQCSELHLEPSNHDCWIGLAFCLEQTPPALLPFQEHHPHQPPSIIMPAALKRGMSHSIFAQTCLDTGHAKRPSERPHWVKHVEVHSEVTSTGLQSSPECHDTAVTSANAWSQTVAGRLGNGKQGNQTIKLTGQMQPNHDKKMS